MIREKIKEILNIPEAIIEVPENKNFGDYSTSVALKLAKKENKDPLAMAQDLAQRIKNNDASREIFAKIEVVPPGFINFTLVESYLQKETAEILRQKEDYGKTNSGGGEKIQIEFISANPTGPLTLGNGRGGFYGDVLANVLACAGYGVKREYYINDAGYQVEILGHSVLKDAKAQYKGDYIELLNKKLIGFWKTKDPKKVGKKAADHIIAEMIRPTIARRMKIKFDEWFFESKLSGKTEKIQQLLKQKDLTYEQDGALWFRSTQFGDDKDRVLITSASQERGQEATYLLPDIAYHHKKFVDDKFDKVIDIWGADHHGYVARLQAAGKALGVWNEENLKIIIMQLVRLLEGGKEVKMSKRAGIYITLDELLDEIPLDVARFFFLMRAPDTHMDFDLDLAREQSEKNPVYYIQYAYARLTSILRKAQNNFQFPISNFQLLNHPVELELIKQLIRLPEVVENTARDYQVQRLPQYALDLVRAFHRFYEECRVISADKEKSRARLGLVEATRIVLKNTLDLMGISAPEKM